MADDQLLTIPEVAIRLRVQTSTVRRWVKLQKLAGYRLGREFRIRESEVERFLQANRTDTANDTEEDGFDK